MKVVVTITLFLLLSCLPLEVFSERIQRKLKVPSDQFRTIQSAIDAAENNDVVLIAPGIYHEVLTISKRITLQGAGAHGKRRTEIQNSMPSEIVPVERAMGCVNYLPGGGGLIKSIAINGCDSTILGQETQGALPVNLEVKDTVLHGTRGILGSFSGITVKDTEIARTPWHGISLVKVAGNLSFSNVLIEAALGWGVYIINNEATPGSLLLKDSCFSSNNFGGVVISGGAKPIAIYDCLIADNTYAGIQLIGADFATISDPVILGTKARIADGKYGDGIIAQCSTNVFVLRSSDSTPGAVQTPCGNAGTQIFANARAGLSNFGSHVTIAGVLFDCNTFDLDAQNEVCNGSDTSPEFLDAGQNVCGCQNQKVACQVKTLSIEPPAPVPQP
jgi:parallel beta helix pectate lyase-like protein